MGVNSSKGFNFRLMASGSDGFTQLDLFADETITVSDNVTGLFDVGVLPSDFTRQISIPGTKVNNAFFEHVYDISIKNPYLFSTNVKVPAYFDFDGLYVSQGYLQLNSVKVRANRFVDSYEISIFGGLSSFARDINRKFLTDLDTLSQYNHTASYDNIVTSWSGSLFSGDIVYPLADYGSGYNYTRGQYEQFGIDDTNGAIAVQNFKPAIRVKPVLDAIFTEAGYTYSSSFLDPFAALPTVFNVSNNGSGNYIINGESNPTLTIVKGQTYTFNINATGHPFWIKTVPGIGTGDAYNTGVTNNGTASGSITFIATWDIPDALYYNCQYHSAMAGGMTIEKYFLDDVYMVCNNSLKYPEFVGYDLETYGKIKVGAISGSGMTDVLLPSGSFVTLPWVNALSDPQGFYNNVSYRVDRRTNITGVLNLNINVSCSANNMPGTLSANGTWQMRLLDTGSSLPVSTRAIQSYIFFFDQLQQSRTGGINTTYELGTEFIFEDVPAGNYYFQIRQSPNFPSSVAALPVVTMDPQGTTKSYIQIKEVKQVIDGLVMDIPSNMPFGTTGIKQIDFIKGLQKKYNLVIYQDKTQQNRFIIETFNDWYDGEVKDFNSFINLNEPIECIPANNLAVNQLNFSDTLDTDYISQQFSKAANREYGKSYFIDEQNFFSQGSFDVKTTFASGPLVRIAGTGLSGSVGGINPPPTSENYVGGCRYGYTFDAQETCTSPAYIQTYTTTGYLETGLIVYRDQYGNNPILNLRYVTGPSGGIIYELNDATGMIGSQTGYFC